MNIVSGARLINGSLEVVLMKICYNTGVITQVLKFKWDEASMTKYIAHNIRRNICGATIYNPLTA
jgi:hypothetical protein